MRAVPRGLRWVPKWKKPLYAKRWKNWALVALGAFGATLAGFVAVIESPLPVWLGFPVIARPDPASAAAHALVTAVFLLITLQVGIAMWVNQDAAPLTPPG